VKFTALARLERNVHRVGEIVGVLAKYGLADWVKGLNYSWIQDRIQSVDGQSIPSLKVEERVRLAFTELGTTFIKLGQVLSTRPDLVGPELANELAHLQTDVPADPPATIRATGRASTRRVSTRRVSRLMRWIVPPGLPPAQISSPRPGTTQMVRACRTVFQCTPSNRSRPRSVPAQR